jgi:hypothetical protein
MARTYARLLPAARNLLNRAVRLRLWTGLMTCFLCSGVMVAESGVVPPADRRVALLHDFFDSYRCPAPYHIGEYLDAADRYEVDYRLLPALSVRESGCGSFGRLNNFWGWDSARSGFSSVAEGIEYITSRLAKAPFYRNKTVEQKLRAYNPVPGYVKSVKSLMQEIE